MPVDFVLARRQQDLLPFGITSFHTRGSHLFLRALLRDARHLGGEVSVVSRGLVLRALLFRRAFSIDQQLARPIEFRRCVLHDIGLGFGCADGAARLIEHAAGLGRGLTTRHA